MGSSVRILLLLLLLVMLILPGCEKVDLKSSPTQLAPRAATTPSVGSVRYLALGDSYTIGESVPPADRWPERLADLIREEKVEVDPPVIVAITGYTTGDLIKKLDREPIAGSFNLVSLMIGVNNQYQGLSEAEYAREFAELLKRATAYAGGDPARVIVVSIPDYGKTPYGQRMGQGHADHDIGRPIDRLNAIAQKQTIAAGSSWIDVTQITREQGGNTKMLANDELHYSRAMHEKWAALALPAARLALGLHRDPTTLP